LPPSGREQFFDQLLDFAGEREAALGLFGEHGLAVDLDLEVAGLADLDLGVEPELFPETVRESDRPRTITSHPAVADIDLHYFLHRRRD